MGKTEIVRGRWRHIYQIKYDTEH